VLDETTYIKYKKEFLSSDAVERACKHGQKDKIGGYDMGGRPLGVLMSEKDWRGLGVQMSAGWIHTMIWAKEPNILLFRRKIDPRQ